MYVHNVIKYMKELSVGDREDLIEKVMHMHLIEKKVQLNKPSVKDKFYNLITNYEGVELKSFEMFVRAIAEINKDQFIDIVLGDYRARKNWRDRIGKGLNNVTISENIMEYFNDDLVLKDAAAVFGNSILFCADEKKNDFEHNLRAFSSFLLIRIEKDK